MDDPLIGTIFDDKYEILALAGTGRTGRVYKARHVMMKRIVAIKVLHDALIGDKVSRSLMEREAKLVSGLTHPNIVSFHEFIVSEGASPYVVMDFVHGSTLSKVIESKGPLPAARAIPIFLQIIAALEYAHSKGVIHRGLTPSKIMLVQTGTRPDFTQIVDFSIARSIDSSATGVLSVQSSSGQLPASNPYASPEQQQDLPLDARSDIYSLGCVMYYSINGHLAPPETNPKGSPYSTARTHAHPSESTPLSLNQVIAQCIEKDPGKRYGSMLKLKQAVESVALKPEEGAWSSVAERKAKKAQPSVLLLSAALMTAVIITAAALWIFSTKDGGILQTRAQLKLQEFTLPPDDERLAQTATKLSDQYLDANRPEDAALVYSRVTNLLARKGKAFARQALISNLKLARLYAMSGNRNQLKRLLNSTSTPLFDECCTLEINATTETRAEEIDLLKMWLAAAEPIKFEESWRYVQFTLMMAAAYGANNNVNAETDILEDVTRTFKDVPAADDEPNRRPLADAYMTLAQVYQGVKKFERAESNAQEAFKLLEGRVNDDNGYVGLYKKIFADIEFALQRYDKSAQLALDVAEINVRIHGNPAAQYELAQDLGLAANSRLAQGKCKEALELAKEAAQVHESVPNIHKELLPSRYILIAECYRCLKDNDNGAKQVQKGIDVANSLPAIDSATKRFILDVCASEWKSFGKNKEAQPAKIELPESTKAK